MKLPSQAVIIGTAAVVGIGLAWLAWRRVAADPAAAGKGIGAGVVAAADGVVTGIVGGIGQVFGLPAPGALNNDPAKVSPWGTEDTAGAWIQSPNNVIYGTVSKATPNKSLGSWFGDLFPSAAEREVNRQYGPAVNDPYVLPDYVVPYQPGA